MILHIAQYFISTWVLMLSKQWFRTLDCLSGALPVKCGVLYKKILTLLLKIINSRGFLHPSRILRQLYCILVKDLHLIDVKFHIATSNITAVPLWITDNVSNVSPANIRGFLSATLVKSISILNKNLFNKLKCE